MVIGKGYEDRFLSAPEIRELAAEALAKSNLAGKRVLVIVPDRTRTAPIPQFFRLIHELLAGQAAALDFLVALGTHQALDDAGLNALFGITAEERATTFGKTRLFNHRWDLPETFRTIGVISAEEIDKIIGHSIGRLEDGASVHRDVPVTLNKLIFDYDQIIICGPTFPHEVVGFSGGAKYFFPGIGGAELINYTHWLGALITSYSIIGTKMTPVREVIHRAARFIPTPTLCFSLVVKGELLAGLYIGPPEEAYSQAADLSSKLHMVWLSKPVRRVLSVMPKMYDDIWTAAKGMYKMEPVIADGGEVVVYAPHITEFSYTHGKVLDQIGYHVRDYFTKQWDRFKQFPTGVIAHSTHLRGIGEYDAATGIERPRIQVTLSTGISRERCERLSLGYLDPATVRPEEWAGREAEGVLLVPKAGEMLYRLKA